MNKASSKLAAGVRKVKAQQKPVLCGTKTSPAPGGRAC